MNLLSEVWIIVATFGLACSVADGALNRTLVDFGRNVSAPEDAVYRGSDYAYAVDDSDYDDDSRERYGNDRELSNRREEDSEEEEEEQEGGSDKLLFSYVVPLNGSRSANVEADSDEDTEKEDVEEEEVEDEEDHGHYHDDDDDNEEYEEGENRERRYEERDDLEEDGESEEAKEDEGEEARYEDESDEDHYESEEDHGRLEEEEDHRRAEAEDREDHRRLEAEEEEAHGRLLKEEEEVHERQDHPPPKRPLFEFTTLLPYRDPTPVSYSSVVYDTDGAAKTELSGSFYQKPLMEAPTSEVFRNADEAVSESVRSYAITTPTAVHEGTIQAPQQKGEDYAEPEAVTSNTYYDIDDVDLPLMHKRVMNLNPIARHKFHWPDMAETEEAETNQTERTKEEDSNESSMDYSVWPDWLEALKREAMKADNVEPDEGAAKREPVTQRPEPSDHDDRGGSPVDQADNMKRESQEDVGKKAKPENVVELEKEGEPHSECRKGEKDEHPFADWPGFEDKVPKPTETAKKVGYHVVSAEDVRRHDEPRKEVIVERAAPEEGPRYPYYRQPDTEGWPAHDEAVTPRQEYYTRFQEQPRGIPKLAHRWEEEEEAVGRPAADQEEVKEEEDEEESGRKETTREEFHDKMNRENYYEKTINTRFGMKEKATRNGDGNHESEAKDLTKEDDKEVSEGGDDASAEGDRKEEVTESSSVKSEGDRNQLYEYIVRDDETVQKQSESEVKERKPKVEAPPVVTTEKPKTEERNQTERARRVKPQSYAYGTATDPESHQYVKINHPDQDLLYNQIVSNIQNMFPTTTEKPANYEQRFLTNHANCQNNHQHDSANYESFVKPNLREGDDSDDDEDYNEEEDEEDENNPMPASKRLPVKIYAVQKRTLPVRLSPNARHGHHIPATGRVQVRVYPHMSPRSNTVYREVKPANYRNSVYLGPATSSNKIIRKVLYYSPNDRLSPTNQVVRIIPPVPQTRRTIIIRKY